MSYRCAKCDKVSKTGKMVVRASRTRTYPVDLDVYDQSGALVHKGTQKAHTVNPENGEREYHATTGTEIVREERVCSDCT